MTNAEKYLKDNVSVEEFASAIVRHKAGRITNENIIKHEIEDIVNWLNTPITPTLTEDERVILRNIKLLPQNKYVIGRTPTGWQDIYIKKVPREEFSEDTLLYFPIYNHLFQFIKERRRIFY